VDDFELPGGPFAWVQGAGRLLMFTGVANFFAYSFGDIERERVAFEGWAIAEAARLRIQRAQTLTLLGAGEVFPAGSVVLKGPNDRPEPRATIVVVTKDELVLLDADPQAPEDEFGRIPRNEIAGVRLLDESGAPATPMTELEELDAPRRPYVVWVDRKADVGERGHVFVFPSYTVAAEAERDFRRQLMGRNRPPDRELPPAR
jgi:hypothetical protein